MKRMLLATTALVALGMGSAPGAVTLFEWAVNIDGVVSNPTAGDPLPGSVNTASWNSANGLGSLVVTVTTPGAHHVSLFVDHEIDEATNTFFNETSSAVGSAAAGQSWETDEPGFAFGDIYDNFAAGALDGTALAGPEDISMALGWDFSLAAGETATLTFRASSVAPSGFHLAQVDPDSQASVHLSSDLRIRGDQPPGVPDGGATLLLFGAAVATLRLVAGRMARRA